MNPDLFQLMAENEVGPLPAMLADQAWTTSWTVTLTVSPNEVGRGVRLALPGPVSDVTGAPATVPASISEGVVDHRAIAPAYPADGYPAPARRRDVIRGTRQSVATAIMPRDRARNQRVHKLLPRALALALGTAVLVAGARSHLMGAGAAGLDNDRMLTSISHALHS